MRRALLLALICTASSCAFFDDDSGDGSYIPYDRVGVAYQDAYCTYAARCGLFPDKAACTSIELGFSRGLAPQVQVGIAAGKIFYNASAVKTCFDAMAAATCDDTDQDSRVAVPACAQFTRGHGMEGEPCFVNEECISGACLGVDPSATCRAGQCLGNTAPTRDPLPIGAHCSSTAECVPGAYCDQQVTQACTAMKTQGMGCMQVEECAYGLFCINTAGTRKCYSLPGPNEPCMLDYLCRDVGLYCNTSMSPPTCKPVGLPPALCTSSLRCSPYYVCDTMTGQCAKGTGLGQSCSPTGQCFATGVYCDTATYTCVALKGDGAMCTSDTECSSKNCDTFVSPSICTTPTTCY